MHQYTDQNVCERCLVRLFTHRRRPVGERKRERERERERERNTKIKHGMQFLAIYVVRQQKELNIHMIVAFMKMYDNVSVCMCVR